MRYGLNHVRLRRHGGRKVSAANIKAHHLIALKQSLRCRNLNDGWLSRSWSALRTFLLSFQGIATLFLFHLFLSSSSTPPNAVHRSASQSSITSDRVITARCRSRKLREFGCSTSSMLCRAVNCSTSRGRFTCFDPLPLTPSVLLCRWLTNLCASSTGLRVLCGYCVAHLVSCTLSSESKHAVWFMCSSTIVLCIYSGATAESY